MPFGSLVPEVGGRERSLIRSVPLSWKHSMANLLTQPIIISRCTPDNVRLRSYILCIGWSDTAPPKQETRYARMAGGAGLV